MIEPTIGDAPTVAGNSMGTMLANRYRVVRPLGRGGMGSVWLVEDVKLDNKPFAVKMLPSILVSNCRAYEQVKREALIALKLVHPNIVQIRALEEAAAGGNPFLVMDYIDGQTLDEYLAEKGELSAEEMLQLLTPVAEALDYAHGEGVVHRDVKPGNVMVRRDGRPFVLDFGIAREIQETMTRVTGKLSSGTLMYMSPEQLHGAVPKPAQDIYSFAAMVYECLTGAPPFSRGQIEYQIDHDVPAPLTGKAAILAAGVMAGLAKKPEDRPVTCLAVLVGNNSTQRRGEAAAQSGRAGAPRPPDVSRVPAAEIQRIREQITARVLRADELYQQLAPFRQDPAGLEAHLQAADDNWAVVKAASVYAGAVDQALLTRTSSALASLEREFLWLQEAAPKRTDCRSVQERIKILETDLLSELGEHLRADARYVAVQKQVEASVNLMQKGDFVAAGASFQKVERAIKSAAEAVRARRANERAACIKSLDEIMARVGDRAEREAENLKDDPDYQKGCALSEEAVRLFDAGDFDGASRTYRAMAECFKQALARLEKARQEKVRALEAEVQAREKKLTSFPKVSWPPNFDRSKISDLEKQAALARGKGDYKQAIENLLKCCDVLAEAYRLAVKKQLANVQFRARQLAAAMAGKPDDSAETKTLLAQARECHTAIAAASTDGASDGGDAVLYQAEQALAALQATLEKVKNIRAAQKRLANVQFRARQLAAALAEKPDDSAETKALLAQAREYHTAIAAASMESAADGGDAVLHQAEQALAALQAILEKVKNIRAAQEIPPQVSEPPEPAAESTPAETKKQDASPVADNDEHRHSHGAWKVIFTIGLLTLMAVGGGIWYHQREQKRAEAAAISAREEAKHKDEEESRQKAATEEAKRKAEEAARQKAAAEEAKRKAEEAARQKAAAEAKAKAEAEAAKAKAEESACQKAAAEEVKRKAEEKRVADEAREAALAAQGKVLKAGGSTIMMKRWNEAITTLEDGNGNYKKGAYVDAKKQYDVGRALFDEIFQKIPKHGEVKTLTLPGGATMEMIYVAPGEFMMGSEDGEEDEKPVHKVTLTKGYWLGKYEVTQKQWQSVMGGNPSSFKGDDRPVKNVSWNDCQEFVQKMNAAAMRQFGGAARLPTEAEWEYACRAGSTGPYGGNGNLDDMGWYLGNSGREETHPVGQKQANAWGFSDMHGNVWEWCNDWFGDYGGDMTDPTGSDSGEYRVLRGGSWGGSARLCRSAYRYRYEPGFRLSDCGFRLCCSAGPRGAEEQGGSVTEEVDELDSLLDDLRSDMPETPPAAQPKDVKNTALKPSDGASLTEPKQGEVKVLTLPGGVEMEMIYVAPGSFTMGSPSSEDGRDDDEAQHRVTLTKGYWLGKYEVTQRQWESVMGNNPSGFKGENCPVDNVSGEDCQVFIAKVDAAARRQLGGGARLPTEAEWEYACRAGTNGLYGEDGNLDEIGWYSGNSGSSTHPVGQKKPNAWGFHDMHGNVWEWCGDIYGHYPNGEVTDPSGPASGGNRVLRGGCWSGSARHCRSAYRGRGSPGFRSDILGFRLAASQDVNREGQKSERAVEASRAERGSRSEAGRRDATSAEVDARTVNVKMDAKTSRDMLPTNPQHGQVASLKLPGGATMEMIYVAPGEFMMGSEDEKPIHKVTLTNGYWLGKYEVTQRQWESVMGGNPSCFKDDDRPVENVSWNDCQEFVQKVNAAAMRQLGGAARLPTEAEWEYACRAGTTGPYGGNGNLDDMGWYASNSGHETHPVGQKKANDWGFHDMHGNVWEWCEDLVQADYSHRVNRGGGWNFPSRFCSAGYRHYFIPDRRNRHLGFRLAASQDVNREGQKSERAVEASRAERGSRSEAGRRDATSAEVDAGTVNVKMDAKTSRDMLPANPQHGQVASLKLLGGTTMEMIYVAPGEFMMGSEDGEEDEKPVHKVTLTKGYWLGKYEVTQRQWGSVMRGNPSSFKGDNRPVENVSWNDCQEFVHNVNAAAMRQFGGAARLPTEAEWEYACRAGTTGLYGGNGNLGDMGWYIDNSGYETHPVGQKQANAWGFYDMHGNVWEWCNDWFGDYGGDTADPTGSASGDSRVSRGGGWRSQTQGCRSADRNRFSPDFRYRRNGFRLCCSAGPCGVVEPKEHETGDDLDNLLESLTGNENHPAARTNEVIGTEMEPRGRNKVQLWEGGPFWAETNIGAEKPEDYGYYFWWGDTVGYKWENGHWVASGGAKKGLEFEGCNVLTFRKNIIDLKVGGWITEENILAPEHDAARVQWGGAWRMPTKQEMEDLNNKCDWAWTTKDGVNGYVVRGRGTYASASIFLPCAGLGYGTSLKRSAGSNGYYWSSVPHLGAISCAWGLDLASKYHRTYYYDRRYMRSVRPVQGFTK